MAPDPIGERHQRMIEEIEQVAKVGGAIRFHDDPLGPGRRQRRGRAVEAEECHLHLGGPVAGGGAEADRGDVARREAERGLGAKEDSLLLDRAGRAHRALRAEEALEPGDRFRKCGLPRLRRERSGIVARAHRRGTRPPRTGQR
jgi:hypothetical protein